MRRALVLLVAMLLLFAPLRALAHSGRTDGIGGHYNNSTGEYHFHHGFSAHHHPNGVCPYDSSKTYPTDKPSRATQKSRPSLSSRSLSVSATATPRPTAAPAATPPPKHVTAAEAFAALSLGSAAAVCVVSLIRLRKRKVHGTAKTIMTAMPGEKFQPIAPPAAAPVVAALPAPVPRAPRLVEVSVVVGYHLRLHFSNGEVRYYDAVFLLSEPGFSRLSDLSVFHDFCIVQGMFLFWNQIARSVTAEWLYHRSSICPTVTVTDKELPF